MCAWVSACVCAHGREEAKGSNSLRDYATLCSKVISHPHGSTALWCNGWTLKLVLCLFPPWFKDCAFVRAKQTRWIHDFEAKIQSGKKWVAESCASIMLFNETSRSEQSRSEGQTGAVDHSRFIQEGLAGCRKGLTVFWTTLAHTHTHTLKDAQLKTHLIPYDCSTWQTESWEVLLSASQWRSEPRRYAS